MTLSPLTLLRLLPLACWAFLIGETRANQPPAELPRLADTIASISYTIAPESALSREKLAAPFDELTLPQSFRDVAKHWIELRKKYEKIEMTLTGTTRHENGTFSLNVSLSVPYVVKGVYFKGNRHIPDESIWDSLDPKITYEEIESYGKALQKFYFENGFLNATIKVSAMKGTPANHLRVIYHITEGEKANIRKYRVPAEKSGLQSKIAVMLRMTDIPGDLALGSVTRRVYAVEEIYREHGYLEAKVSEKHEPVAQDLFDVIYQIHEGEMFLLESIRFENPDQLPIQGVESLVRAPLHQPPNSSAIEQDADKINAFLRDKTSHPMRVIPEIRREGKAAHLVFHLTKIRPFRIEQIDFHDGHPKPNLIADIQDAAALGHFKLLDEGSGHRTPPEEALASLYRGASPRARSVHDWFAYLLSLTLRPEIADITVHYKGRPFSIGFDSRSRGNDIRTDILFQALRFQFDSARPGSGEMLASYSTSIGTSRSTTTVSLYQNGFFGRPLYLPAAKPAAK